MASPSALLQSASSVIFRVLTFIYLRISPIRPGYIVIPSVFVVYLVFLSVDVFSSRSPPHPLASQLEQDQNINAASVKDETDPNPDVKKASITSVKTTPPHVPTLNTILFTLPTTSWIARLAGLFINLALLAMIVDFVGRPLLEKEEDLVFTRVGAVYSDTAKIVVRYPSVDGGVRIVWKQTQAPGSLWNFDKSTGWMNGPLLELTPKHDWVGVGKLESLWASTGYQYRLASANGTLLPYPATPISFRTFPDSRIPGTRFKFLASSCILPNFPYVPLTPSTRLKGFQLLHKQLFSGPTQPASTSNVSIVDPASTVPVPAPAPSVTNDVPAAVPVSLVTVDDSVPEATSTPPLRDEADEDIIAQITSSPLSLSSSESSDPFELASRPEFMLFLGDFIYSDIPFSVGDYKEEYRRLYRRIYASEDFRKVYERLPIFNIYDDHDIVNNYNGYSNDSSPLFRNASDAYSIFHGQANYDSNLLDVNGQPANYFEFQYGDVAFFVLDTRRYRSIVGIAEDQVPTMLGEKQFADLHRWIAKVNSTATFKFIVSSVPLSAMWAGPDGQVDTWAGADAERRAFLDLLDYVPNVIVISGDRHEFAAIEYITGIHEFSIGPMSQFYIPFVRTFYQKNGRYREVKTTVNVTAEDGSVNITEIVEKVPEENIIKYLPHGNYKWATFEVDTTDSQKPTVKIELSIEGSKVWEYAITGKPVHYTGGTALGSQIADTLSGSLKGVLESLSKLGRWLG